MGGPSCASGVGAGFTREGRGLPGSAVGHTTVTPIAEGKQGESWYAETVASTLGRVLKDSDVTEHRYCYRQLLLGRCEWTDWQVHLLIITSPVPGWPQGNGR